MHRIFAFACLSGMLIIGAARGQGDGLDPAPPAPCIALTFDDGPDRVFTPRLLSVLEEQDAVATFFVLGQRVAAEPALVKRAYDDGDEIGNHSWNHPLLTLLSDRDVQWQIARTDAAVKEATGTAPALLRAPYGSLSRRVLGLASRPFIGWNIDTLDWRHHDPEWIIGTVVDRARNGSIVIMHDTHPKTVAAVPGLIGVLRALGFRLVTVSQLRSGACAVPEKGG